MADSPGALIAELVGRILRDSPMQSGSLWQTVGALSPEECGELEAYVRHCQDSGIGLDRLSEAYRVISADTLREQVYFRRHGRYRYSTFAEVADKVYFDQAYMSNYMFGLALTQFLWPNHLEISRFFRASLPRAGGGRYLEVGPGHGAYFLLAMRSGRFSECLGVDISPTSLALTRALLEVETAGHTPWKLMESDFLAFRPEEQGFDAIVMGEVLEHVENPKDFLINIRQLANPGAFIFVTTAVNAPAVDHIYLYRRVEDVVAMAQDAGLSVVDRLATPYPGCTMERTVSESLPINVALVLTK